jgi:hypothetical protein
MVESPLFRLPPELRKMIYEYVFQAEHILVRKPRMFPPMYHKCWYTVLDSRLSRFSKPLLEVLRTRNVSRQFYAETKLFPFAINTLSGEPHMFVAASTSMPSEVVEVITTVKILLGWSPWEKEGCRTLAPLTPFKALTGIEIESKTTGVVTPDMLADAEKWLTGRAEREAEAERETEAEKEAETEKKAKEAAERKRRLLGYGRR